MKNKEEKIEQYLRNREETRRERLRKEAKPKPVKDYSLDEFPERRAVKKAARFLFSQAKRKHKDLKRRAEEKELERRAKKAPKRYDYRDIYKKEERKKMKRRGGLIVFLSRSVVFLVYLLIFLMPLLFNPWTASMVDFPKQLILVILTGLGILLWLGKMIIADKVEVKKSFLLVPILAFLGAYTLSGILAGYPYLSFWGSLSQEGFSVLTLIALIGFFFVATNNIRSKKRVNRMLFLLMISSLIAAGFAIAQFLGFHVFEMARLEERLINSIGNQQASVIYFSGIAILAAGLSVFSKDPLAKLVYWVTALASISYLTFSFYKPVAIIFVLAAGLMFAVAIAQRKIRRDAKGSLVLPMLVFAFALFMVLMGRPVVDLGVASSEIFLNFQSSWGVMAKALKANPFLGTGPGTFGNLFELFKPDMGRFSGVAASGPFGYILLLAMTTGFITVAAYLFLLFVLSRFALANMLSILLGKNKRGDLVVAAVTVFFLFLAAANFVNVGNILILFVFWLALVIIDINRPVNSVFSAALKEISDDREFNDYAFQIDFARISLVVSVLFVAAAASFAAVFYISSRRYLGEVYFRRALVGNIEGQNLEGIVSDVGRAAEIDDGRDLYFRNLGIVYLALAKERTNKVGGSFSGEDSKLISDSVSKAVLAAEQAIELNPYDYENYRNLGWIYQEMESISGNFGDKSLDSYKKARELSPKNPEIYYQIANLRLRFYNGEISKQQQQQTQAGGEKADKTLSPKAKEHLLAAKENVEEALALNKWHFGSNILLVTIEELLGEDDAALVKAKENWELFYGNGQAGFSLASQHYKRGEYLQAKKILETVLEKNSNYSNARYLLGFCLAQAGDLDGALDNFLEVQLKNPDSEELSKIVKDLRAGKTDFLKEEGSSQSKEGAADPAAEAGMEIPAEDGAAVAEPAL